MLVVQGKILQNQKVFNITTIVRFFIRYVHRITVAIFGSFLGVCYGKPDYQASTMVISESDEVMAGNGVVMGADGHC